MDKYIFKCTYIYNNPENKLNKGLSDCPTNQLLTTDRK